ncbi:sensor histidine kinase [Pontibacter silvestris]|uniref:Sensor histidine kinase n=1 Tax=Pontibacter silvestris TaxID=2305183 RepID=A0ABW4X2Y7_9BACT|nr:sensor histidine kinase [Pontibacter silvestris]MCC9136098.1 sensor histidine kinase [Pontibacter silvestris]
MKSDIWGMFRSKAFSVVTHIIGWTLFMCLPVFFLSHEAGKEQLVLVLSSPAYWKFYGCYIFLFYFHTYLLVPYFFFQKKYVSYAAVILVLFIAVFFLRPFDNLIARSIHRPAAGNPGPPREMDVHRPHNTDKMAYPVPPPRRGPQGMPPPDFNVQIDIVSILLFVMVMALSLALESTRHLRMTEKRAIRAEADKANAELSTLKAQVNPHFLFNTLNNIYSLAVTHDDNTAASIMKLSNIMRYVTDEVSEEYGSLAGEVACLSDFIDLQRLRLGEKVQVNFTVSGQLKNKQIAPLLLMTFVENVFKHGISSHYDSPITIKIISKADSISFYCQNRIFVNNRSNERTGIGIANTKERLRHLYPGKHQLEINTENGFFTVQLQLEVG